MVPWSVSRALSPFSGPESGATFWERNEVLWGQKIGAAFCIFRMLEFGATNVGRILGRGRCPRTVRAMISCPKFWAEIWACFLVPRGRPRLAPANAWCDVKTVVTIQSIFFLLQATGLERRQNREHPWIYLVFSNQIGKYSTQYTRHTEHTIHNAPNTQYTQRTQQKQLSHHASSQSTEHTTHNA